jgi:hypothetical protein
MRCGFLLVEGCMVTCLVFNSEDYSCVICWLFNPFQTSLSEWSDVLQRKTMDCFSFIFSLSFQYFYTSFGGCCSENNFILDYLSESSRHEANILSKWVWIFSLIRSQQQYEATLLMWWFLIDTSPIYTCISCYTYINKTVGFVKCFF